jgi:hypothetical protein
VSVVPVEVKGHVSQVLEVFEPGHNKAKGSSTFSEQTGHAIVITANDGVLSFVVIPHIIDLTIQQ